MMMLSFRTFHDIRWDVTPESPVVWIELLDETLYSADGYPGKEDQFTGSLSSLKGMPVELQRSEIWRQVLKDLNSVETAFIKLRLKPGQINSIDQENQYGYDEEYAKRHTIKIKILANDKSNGGNSNGDLSSQTMTACTINFGQAVPDVPKRYKLVATHEIMHCLGVDHDKEDGDSLMSYDQVQTDLAAADRAALTHLYPLHPAYGKEEDTLGLACSTKR